VRHAKSDQKGDPAIADFDRPLSRRGERDAPKMAERLAASGLRVDALVSSPALRAKTTADAFAAALSLPVQTDERIYEADVLALQETVRGFDDHLSTVAVFGHNPGFSDFLRYLTEEPYADLPTAAVAVVELPLKSWKHVYQGKGFLKTFLAPRRDEIGRLHYTPPQTLTDRFRFWRFQRAQRLELIIALVVGLLLLALLIPLIMRGTINAKYAPVEGSRPHTVIDRQ
jgi:phosphohistidine phosphatase